MFPVFLYDHRNEEVGIDSLRTELPPQPPIRRTHGDLLPQRSSSGMEHLDTTNRSLRKGDSIDVLSDPRLTKGVRPWSMKVALKQL